MRSWKNGDIGAPTRSWSRPCNRCYSAGTGPLHFVISLSSTRNQWTNPTLLLPFFCIVANNRPHNIISRWSTVSWIKCLSVHLTGIGNIHQRERRGNVTCMLSLSVNCPPANRNFTKPFGCLPYGDPHFIYQMAMCGRFFTCRVELILRVLYIKEHKALHSHLPNIFPYAFLLIYHSSPWLSFPIPTDFLILSAPGLHTK